MTQGLIHIVLPLCVLLEIAPDVAKAGQYRYHVAICLQFILLDILSLHEFTSDGISLTKHN